GTATQRFTLVVDEAPKITSRPQATAQDGATFRFQVMATGYPKPTFAKVGSLPKGVSLSPSGLLLGTPVAAANYIVTISAANALGTARQDFTIKVLSHS
ncbi:MAG TPA: putative Ig domain-containing protein, partial [Acidimicrobiales bacterium]|nr:putative Ig domain-containing protein [Acidimicrobiales bacterium]